MANLTLEFVDSMPLYQAGDWEALQLRAEEEGYLFFKKLLPREPIDELRRELLKVVGDHGWLKKSEELDLGCIDLERLREVPADQMRLDIGVTEEAYGDAQRLEALHRLPHHPRLLALYRGLFGEEPLVHPRHIARMITGHPAMHPTPQHQDFPLIQGSEQTWTCWFPLGNCPRNLGGLTVLQKSNQLGYVPIQQASGAGNIAVQLCPGDEVWVEGDFEMGDVLTFPCYTVHRALKSQQKELIRLSLDVRYQPMSEPIEDKSLLPHCELSWESIYKNWHSNDLKYYWKKANPERSEWNSELLQPSQRIC